MKNLLIGLVALWIGVPALLAAQSAENKLSGVWEVKILPKDAPPPPLLSIAIFGGDGSFATKVSAKFPPVPPFKGFVDEVGPGYGRWVQSSNKEFKLTFYAVLLKEGVANGYQRVRSTMTLSESGNEFTAHESNVDFLDTNWNVVFSSTDEVTGKRLETSE
jgi:hypothetical protein